MPGPRRGLPQGSLPAGILSRQVVLCTVARGVRSIAVDWSGALAGVARKLCLAEARGGRLVRVELGRSREELVEHLIDCARRDPRLIVGFDFSFGFPAWFSRAFGAADAGAVWELAAREGERWLVDCPDPFWGRPGRPRPPSDAERTPFRRTEGETPPIGGIHPKSTFQVGGAGSVGTGSIRGMPFLTRLRAEGFRVLPLDDPPEQGPSPVAFELWPRLLTGRVNKRDGVTRWTWLQYRFREQPFELLRQAAVSEDTFDAAVSALQMDRLLGRGDPLPVARDELDRLEGRIWRPLVDPLVMDPPFGQLDGRGWWRGGEALARPGPESRAPARRVRSPGAPRG